MLHGYYVFGVRHISICSTLGVPLFLAKPYYQKVCIDPGSIVSFGCTNHFAWSIISRVLFFMGFLTFMFVSITSRIYLEYN